MECSSIEKDDKVEITIKGENHIKKNINIKDGLESEIIEFISPSEYKTSIAIDPELATMRIAKSYRSPEKSIQTYISKWNQSRSYLTTSYNNCTSGGNINCNFWTVELRNKRVLVKLNGKKANQNIDHEKLLPFMTNIRDSIDDLVMFLKDIFVRDQINNRCDDWRTLHF